MTKNLKAGETYVGRRIDDTVEFAIVGECATFDKEHGFESVQLYKGFCYDEWRKVTGVTLRVAQVKRIKVKVTELPK